MNRLSSVRARLHSAAGVPSVLDAAHQVFEGVLVVLRGGMLAPSRPASRNANSAKRKPQTLIRAALPANPLAARQARQQLREALTQRGLASLAPDAELLTSELVANAAEHAGGQQIGLVVREQTTADGRTSITCEVTDQSQDLPRPKPAGEHAERGRGLAIVAALAAESGIRGGPGGKTCWFTLTVTADPAPNARKTPPETDAEPRRLTSHTLRSDQASGILA